MRLEIAAALLARIMAEADAAAPEEACGLMVGRRGQGWARVARLVSARNVAEEPRRRFEIDPAALLATHREAREAGEEIIGPWHSHPAGPPEPSATDVARAREAASPGDVWLIVAPGDVWPIVVPEAGRAGGVRARRARAFTFEGGGLHAAELAELPPAPEGH